MASNRIRGITLEIGGDTTKLQDSLKQVDKVLKDTQAELKDVNKLLKLDPTNVDLLRQKQELLGKSVAATKERQEELKKALEEAKKAGDTEENRHQQDLLQRELAETTASLKDLEKQYASCSPKLEALSAKTGQMAEKTKGLSTAAGVAAAGMVAMAVSASNTADELLTTSKVTGFSVEELQKLKYAVELVDVSYDTMTGSISKLTKAMGSENKAFDKLGVAIRNQDGSLRSAVDVWYDTLEALGKVENETERDTLSMELFGKSAMEMAGIVDDGGAKLKALGDEAEAAGLIMSGDAVNGAGSFNDALQKLKTTAELSFASAGSALAESLLPALEKLITLVSSVLEWFAGLDGTTQTVILTVLGLVAAISPLLGLISTLTGLAAALNVSMLPMIATIGGIVIAIGALVAAGVYLYNHWEEIKEKAAALWAAIKETFEDMKNGIIQRWENIKTKAGEIFENIKTKITTPIEKAKEKVKEIIDKIKDFFHFEVSLPHIKLPHFAINPPGWKLGDLLKGSIPSLGINWYAKAMEHGMVLDHPTIFGMQDGQLLGGGEAGREVVIGEAALKRMLGQASGTAVNVSVVVNGNVDNYDLLAETIGEKLQQQMAREGRAFA